jgi:MoaA/NifB/PqqE/SkfB family radical SAM enzyme
MVIPYTKLKEHNRQNLVDVIPLDKPFTLIIEPTGLCNFKCVQCYQSIAEETYFSRNKGSMSLDTFNRVVDEMAAWTGPRLKVLKLSLYGEPLLNFRFTEMLRITKEMQIAERIETTTNAFLLNEEVAKRIVEYNLDYLRVSIYSPIQEKHERITGSHTRIDEIQENLARLQRLKQKQQTHFPFVGVKMLDTFSSENEVFVEKFRDVADEIYFDKPHGWVSHERKDFLADLYGHEQKAAKADVAQSRSHRVACTLPFFTLAVRSNGDVSPCCIDWIGGTNLGNVYQEKLEDIWHGDRM